MTISNSSPWTSPSLVGNEIGDSSAFEEKFLLDQETSLAIQDAVKGTLQVDPHSQNGQYQITSVYFDTPGLDVFHRNPGYETHKYRVRRYGNEEILHLERKSKKAGRVWKCRTTVQWNPQHESQRDHFSFSVSPAAEWFHRDLSSLNLNPACVITYSRKAWVGSSSNGPIRLTMDRSALWKKTTSPIPHLIQDGANLFPGHCVLELKFLGSMPVYFKELISRFQLDPTGLSKYRLSVRSMDSLVAA